MPLEVPPDERAKWHTWLRNALTLVFVVTAAMIINSVMAKDPSADDMIRGLIIGALANLLGLTDIGGGVVNLFSPRKAN